MLRGTGPVQPDVPDSGSHPNDNKLLLEYQKACSEVIVLRKGLVEILHSVREHDGNSNKLLFDFKAPNLRNDREKRRQN